MKTLTKKVSIIEPSHEVLASEERSPTRERTFLGVGPKFGDGVRHRLGLPQEVPKPSPSEMEELELEIEEEEEGSEADDEKKDCFRNIHLRWIGIGFRWFCPGYTPFLMMLVFLIVSVGLAARRFSESEEPTFKAYAVYLGVTALILVGWLIFRMIWMGLMYAYVLQESRFSIAMNAVLDPHLTYLAAAISISLFWAYVPVAYGLQAAFGIDKLEEGSHNDLLVLLRVNLFMMVWAVRVGR